MFHDGSKATKAIRNVLVRDITQFSGGSFQRSQLRKRGCPGDGLKVAMGVMIPQSNKGNVWTANGQKSKGHNYHDVCSALKRK